MNPQKSPSLPPKTSPSIPWGSPALRPNASFPPSNQTNYTPPHRPPMQLGTRSFGRGKGSPQFGIPFGGFGFRTPQPQPPQHFSPNTPIGPWSDNKGNKGKHYQGNDSRDSPRDSPSMNPGGSNNILNYYSPAMVKDPWLNTPPQPVEFWKFQ